MDLNVYGANVAPRVMYTAPRVLTRARWCETSNRRSTGGSIAREEPARCDVTRRQGVARKRSADAWVRRLGDAVRPRVECVAVATC